MTAFSNLARNLLAGLRLVVFLPLQRSSFRLSPGQLPLLIVIGFAVQFLGEFVTTDDGRSFNIYGVASTGTAYLALLLTLTLIARIQGHMLSAVPLAIVLLSSGLVFSTLAAVADYLATGLLALNRLPAIGVVIVSIFWMTVLMFRAVRLIYRATIVRALALGALYVVCATVIAVGIPQEPIWYDDDFDWDKVHAQCLGSLDRCQR